MNIKINWKEVRTRVLYFAIGVAVGALSVVYAPKAMAHSGGMAADDCHNMRVDGEIVERHWHVEGTMDRGGHCETDDDGTTWHITEVEEPECPVCPDNTAIETQLQTAENELQVLQSLLGESRSAEERWRRRALNAEDEIDSANRKAYNARESVVEANERVAEVERQLASERKGEPICVAEREALDARVQESWARKWRVQANALVRCLRGH